MWTGNPTTAPEKNMYLYFDWAKSVERLYGDIELGEFPEERAKEVSAMVAPYQHWYAKQAQHWGEPNRQRCQYCAQVSPDDSRGGCVACGGPRPEYKPPKRILKNWRI